MDKQTLGILDTFLMLNLEVTLSFAKIMYMQLVKDQPTGRKLFTFGTWRVIILNPGFGIAIEFEQQQGFQFY